jgi:hypothetical protein
MKLCLNRSQALALVIGVVCGGLFLAARERQRSADDSPILTLAEAQRQFPHRILVPHAIPPEVKFIGARVSRPYFMEDPNRQNPVPGHWHDDPGFFPFHLDSDQAYPVIDLWPCSPAESAGLRKYDQLLSVGDNFQVYSARGMRYRQGYLVFREEAGRISFSRSSAHPVGEGGKR